MANDEHWAAGSPAVLLHLTQSPLPRTHDLGLLLDLLEEASAQEPRPLNTLIAQRLTQYAVITRYPTDLGEIEEDEWRRAVSDAAVIVAWAEEIITN